MGGAGGLPAAQESPALVWDGSGCGAADAGAVGGRAAAAGAAVGRAARVGACAGLRDPGAGAVLRVAERVACAVRAVGADGQCDDDARAAPAVPGVVGVSRRAGVWRDGGIRGGAAGLHGGGGAAVAVAAGCAGAPGEPSAAGGAGVRAVRDADGEGGVGGAVVVGAADRADRGAGHGGGVPDRAAAALRLRRAAVRDGADAVPGAAGAVLISCDLSPPRK